MTDSRLSQISAAADDARTVCADILEDDPPVEWAHGLTTVQMLLNDAIHIVNDLICPVCHGTGIEPGDWTRPECPRCAVVT